MAVPLASKLVGAVLIYGLGIWAMDRALGGAWNGLTVVGIGLLLYGVWYSTARGRADRGDIAIALAVSLVLGQGTLLLLHQGRLLAMSGPALIGWGHLLGLGILGLAWLPLMYQGLLPGGPDRNLATPYSDEGSQG